MAQVLTDPGTLFLITASLLAFAGVLAIGLILTPSETPKARLRAAALGGRRNLGPAKLNQPLGRRFAATIRRVLGSFDLIKTK